MSRARQFRLSKSKIASFEACAKRLWLEIHRREVGSIDQRTQEVFAAGHLLGELAREAIPGGVLVDTDPKKVDEAIEQTARLVSAGGHQAIFEPAFLREDVVVRSDVLQPDGWGGWKLIEVKNSTKVSAYMLRDVSTQSWVLRAQPMCVSSVSIRLVSRRLVGRKRPNAAPRFVDVDVTHRIQDIVAHRSSVIQRARSTVEGPEPHRSTGSYCTWPFQCQFLDYCQKPRRAGAI